MRRLAWIAVVFCLIGGPVFAASDLETCQSNRVTANVSEDARIAACTRAIASGKLAGSELESAYYERGLAYRILRRSDEAIRDLSRTIEINPRNTWSYVARGHAYADKKDFPRAFKDQEAAIKLEPSAVTYTGRAIDLMAAGAYDLAIADLNEALRRDEKYFYGYLYRGDANRRKGDFDAAQADYRKALELRPNDDFARRGLDRARNRNSD